MTTPEHAFWATVDAIRERDPRYRREAYAFVMRSLAAVARTLPPERAQDPVRRHLSGGELLRGALVIARQEFGVLAPTVLREWGLLSGLDFGRIVFQLVEAGELSARPEDSLDDFRGMDDLPTAVSAAPGARGTRPR